MVQRRVKAVGQPKAGHGLWWRKAELDKGLVEDSGDSLYARNGINMLSWASDSAMISMIASNACFRRPGSVQ